MARGVERGDIWLYRFAAPDERRPVLVLSRNALLRHTRTAMVAPITSTVRGAPTEIELDVEHGLKARSVARLDNILTIPQSELRRWVGHVGSETMDRVCAAAEIALGCS